MYVTVMSGIKNLPLDTWLRHLFGIVYPCDLTNVLFKAFHQVIGQDQ